MKCHRRYELTSYRGPFIIMAVAIMIVFSASLPLVMAGKPNNPPTGFNISTIDKNGGLECRVVADSQNHLHVTYYDPSSHALKYATNAGGSWAIETIDIVGSVMGGVADLALDSVGAVHILYFEMGQNLIYTHKVNGAWLKQNIDTAVAGQCSIVIDGSDVIHICYWENSDPNINSIMFGTLSYGSWNLETVVQDDDAISWSTEMVLDGNDKVHILWMFLNESKLHLATRGETGWTSEILPIAGTIRPDASIVIDPSNVVHLAYVVLSGSTYQYWYANNAGGSWHTWLIDTMSSVWAYPSITLDASGHAYISYAKYSTSTKTNLWYATNLSGNWATKLVDGSRNVGVHSDIVVDSASKVHILYSGNPSLKYAKSI